MNDRSASAPTILIVDDEADVREMLRDALVQDGYNVTLSASGRGLIELIDSLVPDLIVLDLLLPGEHGLDLVATIKKRFFIPTLIISGVYMLEEIQAQLETTMVEGFFEKPINMVNLRSMIKKILG